MARPSLLPAALAALLLLVWGCALDVGPPPGEPMSVPRRSRNVGPEAGTPPDPSAFLDMVAHVEDLLQRHDYSRALEAIDAARALGPPWPVLRRLEALRVDCKQNLLQSMYVDALILLDRERVALGDPITGRLLLVNLASRPVVIPAVADEGGARPRSRTTIHVDVSCREYCHDGTVVSDRITWNMEVGEDVVLAPGERRQWPLKLETLHFNPGRATFRSYRVEAMLYPSAIRIGGEEYPGNLRFRPRTCGVFPRNFEHLLDNPLGRLRQAVGHPAAAAYLPLIAALVGEDDRERAVRYLLSVIRRAEEEDPGGETRVACCVGLRILTGAELPARPEVWKSWKEGG